MSNRLSSILQLVWFDLKTELKPPVWIVVGWTSFLVQAGIYGLMISHLVESPYIIDYR